MSKKGSPLPLSEKGGRTRKKNAASKGRKPSRSTSPEAVRRDRRERGERGGASGKQSPQVLLQPGAVAAASVSAEVPGAAFPSQDLAGSLATPAPPSAPPEILAPAGDMASALAGLAGGADALYLGLKHFSARMQAENFSSAELSRLADLAHSEGRRVYVAMNTMLKPGEAAQAYRLVRRLAGGPGPDALILQDTGMISLARQAGFTGELHLSTLANVTHQRALLAALSLGAARVILPRELTLEEIALMDRACPEGLDLELFVHGALCFCVSGRCWWSGYMGGKSGLRGRCVQPCRRVYDQKGRKGRFFSCRDLSLDSAARELLALPRIRSWKIEGRKKGPHYVYHVSRAYRLLRDEPDNALATREARELLDMALGRPGTRALFFDLKAPSPSSPPPGKSGETSSGLLCGGILKDSDFPAIRPRLNLLPGDLLRVGYEDEVWHATVRLAAATPAGAELRLPLSGPKRPRPGTPVFLIDRKDAALKALLAEWTRKLESRPGRAGTPDVGGQSPVPPQAVKPQAREKTLDIRLSASLPHGREAKDGLAPGAVRGLWLSPAALREVSRTLFARISWWLPPVIWPGEEDSWAALVQTALRRGARHLVCNAPWQAAFFPDKKGLALTAGPFCNLAGPFALEAMRGLGFSTAVISPELGGEDFLSLPGQSPLPLGIVLSGYWPVGLTRHQPGALKAREAFASPKGESFWMRRYGQNLWVYPAWPVDLTAQRPALERAGYKTFIHMDEHPPRSLEKPDRPGEFNWNIGML